MSQVTPTAELPEVLVVQPRLFRDDRGHFLEIHHSAKLSAAGLAETFVQDNASRSVKGVLRGLHYQHPRAQGKFVSVLFGEIYDVAVDIRVGSPTFGRWVGVTLSADAGTQLYIPGGYAHGFAVTSPEAVVLYKCTDLYDPACEGSIRWDDPAIGVDWPVSSPLLAPKDADAPRLADVPRDRLPTYGG